MKRVRFLTLGIVLAVIALALIGYTSAWAQGISEEPPTTNVSVSVDVAGLEKGDNVIIYGGLVPKDENQEMLQDSFTLKVSNGLTRLPIVQEGLWEVSTVAVDYGEIPETYEVLVQGNTEIVLEFKIGEALPILGESLRLEKGAELGFIGYIQSKDGEAVLGGKDGRVYYRLESDRIDLSVYNDKKVWILGVVKEDEPLSCLNVRDVVEPGHPIWTVDSVGNVLPRSDSTIQGRAINRPTMIDEIDIPVGDKAEATTRDDPPELQVIDYDVGGEEDEIDLVATSDEGEQFWNFDQTDDSTSAERDHAVCMFFYDNAEVDKVKDIYWGTSTIHSTMHQRLYDDSYTDDFEYDQDKGTRSNPWPLVQAKHMRVYAPYPEDKFYDVDLGYFVIGTVHWDHSNNTEEDTEDALCDIAIEEEYTVYEDYCWISTEEGSNNGYISYVCVP